jgi:hypothetical protein
MLVSADQLRLPLARMAAWALLVAAWLALGALGYRHVPLWAGGMLPLALWLACMAGCMRLSVTVLRPQHLSSAIAVSGLVCAAGLCWAPQGGAGAGVLVAAVAWAVLLVAASHTVRQLRPGDRQALPLWPVAVGLMLGGGASLELVIGAGSTAATLALVLGAAVLLLVLRSLPLNRLAGGHAGACRQGLFDCALPLSTPLIKHRGLTAIPVDASPLFSSAALSVRGARWAMLPMMAALPTMTAWCATSVPAAPAPALLLAMHLGAMVAPAWALRGLARLGLHLRTAAACAALLVAGGVMLLAAPSLRGLMLATLLHTCAWSVAWEPGLRKRADAPRAPPPRAVPVFAMAAPLCLLLLGAATATFGPQALMAVHGALALLGLLSCWPALKHIGHFAIRQLQTGISPQSSP